MFQELATIVSLASSVVLWVRHGRMNWGRPATAYQPPSTREPPWGLDLDQLIHSSNATPTVGETESEPLVGLRFTVKIESALADALDALPVTIRRNL